MTDLIAQQLTSGVLMLYCGLACGMVFQLFSILRLRRAKSAITGFLLEVTSLVFSGYCITAFLYCSSWGKIMPQDVVCFFGGLWLWRRLYGEEGEPSSGVREKSSGAGHNHSTERTKEEKRKKENE